MQGFPVSSSGSRTAIGDAEGGRTQLHSLVTAGRTVVAVLVLRPLLAAFPTAALGAVVVYAAVRLDRRRRVPAAGPRSAAASSLLALATTAAVLVVGVLHGVLVAIGALGARPAAARRPPARRRQGFVPDVAGMHDVDDYPDAEPVPGLLVYRYDSPLFFANAEDFRRRALAARRRGRASRSVVPAQRRGDHRGRHHRRGRARGAAQRADRAGHRLRHGAHKRS